jgi:hypothetical protein
MIPAIEIEKREIVRYELDAADRICALDDAWAEFARANGAPELTRKGVLGRSIFDFVAGREVQELYRLLHARARASGSPVTIPLRCDSPEERRFVELAIIPLPGGGLACEGRLLASERRKRVALLDRSTPRDVRWVSICSWCKKIRVAARWVEAEDALPALDVFAERQPSLTHGICPDCEALHFRDV